MKRHLLRFAIVLALLTTLFRNEVSAVPAIPEPVRIRQADGSYITVVIRGDEHFHYTTTPDGVNIVCRNGIWYYAERSKDGIVSSGIRVGTSAVRSPQEQSFLSSPKAIRGIPESIASKRHKNIEMRAGLTTGFPTTGQIRSLVILVNFSDLEFESPTAQSDFDKMLNSSGWSYDGATGSARDYFLHCSGGQFQPQFDVFGPVTLSKSYQYYGGNKPDGDDNDAEGMIAEACRLADEQGVNFADYDYNNDNIVDNVFVFYAGTNEADGGGDDKIWPHRYQLELGDVVLDGKSVFIYACTSEKRMHYEGPKMAGIGTFCHEFTHVLGLPDFYDTDGSYDGYSNGLGTWSIMANGPYNNEGRTPPAFSAMERYLAKWTEPQTITNTGNYTLEDLNESNKAYLLPTDTEGEYFLLENRQNDNIWDSYLEGHGLMMYHVDRSDRLVSGYTAADRWEYNWPNNVAAHECMRIISAQYNAGVGSESAMPYPGTSGNDEFSRKSLPSNKSWSGEYIDAEIINIKESSGKITFRAVTSLEEIVPVSGVEISGRDRIIVNDTVRLKATVMPENAADKRVIWESLSPETLSVDTTGTATGLKEGQGSVRVTTVDGEFTDEFTISVVSGQIFRGRTVSSAGTVLTGVSVAIESATQSYQYVSDASGTITADDLTSGNYTVTIDCDNYPQQTKMLRIGNGASICDIIIFNASELAEGTGNIRPETTPYEESAFLVWKAGRDSLWRVEWYEEGKEDERSYLYTDVPKADITGLERETKYTAIIYTVDRVIDAAFSITSFETCAPTGDYPCMLLNSLYEKGESVLLKCANLPSGAKLTWLVDGKVCESNEFTAEKKEHKIDLVIETETETETITKYIQTI